MRRWWKLLDTHTHTSHLFLPLSKYELFPSFQEGWWCVVGRQFSQRGPAQSVKFNRFAPVARTHTHTHTHTSIDLFYFIHFIFHASGRFRRRSWLNAEIAAVRGTIREMHRAQWIWFISAPGTTVFELDVKYLFPIWLKNLHFWILTGFVQTSIISFRLS